MPRSLTLNFRNQLSLEDLDAYARGLITRVALDGDAGFKRQIEDNHRFLITKVADGWPIYGASTGFGSSSASRIGFGDAGALQTNLYRYHGCGLGPSFSEDVLAAILLVRLNCLTQGRSGVSFDLLERLGALLDRRILPLIPERGSVGASGDLTPLSYIAAVLGGEREALCEGRTIPAAEVWQRLETEPYAFKAREALAIMNGTSVMAAVAGLAWKRLERLYEGAALATAAMVEIWQGPCAPFLPALHRVKPHVGQGEAAAAICQYLYEPEQRLGRRDPKTLETTRAGSVQDPYSIRCAPQILGSFKEALNTTRLWIETEINSVNDNPVFLHEEDLVLNGGHFLGQHMTLACDMLKAAAASTINLLDRQMALLMESKGRLPENLVSRQVSPSLYHGFKAMQISMSSLASEIAKLATPMSVFSRPTEASNQDVVSMGTIAARDILAIADIALDGLSIHLMALTQAFHLLAEEGHELPLHPRFHDVLLRLQRAMPQVREDRALDHEIRGMKALLTAEASLWR